MFNSLQLGISYVAFITDIVRLIYCLLNKERIITFDDKKKLLEPLRFYLHCLAFLLGKFKIRFVHKMGKSRLADQRQQAYPQQV